MIKIPRVEIIKDQNQLEVTLTEKFSYYPYGGFGRAPLYIAITCVMVQIIVSESGFIIILPIAVICLSIFLLFYSKKAKQRIISIQKKFQFLQLDFLELKVNIKLNVLKNLR